MEITMMDVKQLMEDPNNARKTYAGIQELSESIKESGLLHPLHIYKENGNYVVLAGNRRLKALKKLGHKKVPCIITEKDFTLSLVENLQRDDLAIEERGKGLLRLKEDLNWTIPQIAKSIGVSESTIDKWLSYARDPEKREKVNKKGKEKTVNNGVIFTPSKIQPVQILSEEQTPNDPISEKGKTNSENGGRYNLPTLDASVNANIAETVTTTAKDRISFFKSWIRESEEWRNSEDAFLILKLAYVSFKEAIPFVSNEHKISLRKKLKELMGLLDA